MASGCVSEQYNRFNGQVVSGNPPVALGGQTHEGCAQWGQLPKDSPVGLWGFSFLDTGGIVFLFDNGLVRSHGNRVTNESLKGVWHFDSVDPRGVDWAKFIQMTDEERARVPGVQSVRGKVKIDHWENNIDLKVSVEIETAEKVPTKLNGKIELFTRDEWHPIEAFVLIMSQLGIGSE
jgi:hypothetical protein